jgi:hypothetical protein
MDSIFTIQQLLERQRVYNKEIYVLFLDYVNAFDSLLRETVWEIMTEK